MKYATAPWPSAVNGPQKVRKMPRPKERVAFLFERYQQLTAPLAAASEKVGKSKGRKTV